MITWSPNAFFVSAVLCLFTSMNVFAQLEVSAQLKPRLELRDGYRIPATPDTETAFFVSQRTRLNIFYTNDKMSLKISPQDVRVWGDENQLGKVPSLGVHEAWGSFHLNSFWQVKLGRQELVYDDHRLMGNVDWVQQGRSHDALLLKYDANDWKMDVGGAFNQMQENVFGTQYVANNYKAMLWFYGQKKAENLTADILWLNDAFEEDNTLHQTHWRHTIGGGAAYSFKKITLKGNAYWQGGKTQTEQKISAYLVAFKADYSLPSMKFTLGADIVSGDNPNDNDYQAFNTLYATNHKFYGLMDYYLNIPNDTKGGGLQDFFLQWSYDATSKTNLQMTVHQFLLSKEVYDSNLEFLDRNMGSEIDLTMNHTINSDVNLKCGASIYLPTYSTQQIKGGDENQVSFWTWAMLSFTPELFKSEDKK